VPYQPAANRYQAMVYRRCGRSGLRLPAISLGLWHGFGEGASLESMRGLLFQAFDLGITHFDLANNYGPPPGAAEESLGRVLTTDLAAHRDELLLSTKAGYPMWPGPYGEWGSRKYLLASLDQSLRRLELWRAPCSAGRHSMWGCPPTPPAGPRRRPRSCEAWGSAA
jgi:L-glyceraldehyde 3-phosphate reductase